MNLICLLIADDLTGAADACVKFVARGFSGTVLFSTDSHAAGSHAADSQAADTDTCVTDVDILAIDTDTRRLSEAEARRRVRATGRFSTALAQGGATALAHCAEPGAVFKKIDSTLRGHVGVEIGAAMDTFGLTHAIVCPAFPAMRRTVRDGLLRDGQLIVTDVAARLGEQGVADMEIARISLGELGGVAVAKMAMEAALARGARALVCDATSQRDLDTIVSAASEAGGRPLWAGSAGLAEALATRLAIGLGMRLDPEVATRLVPELGTRLARELATRVGPDVTSARSQVAPQSTARRATSAASVLLFVGSVHAVTREQQARLLRAREVALVDIGLDARQRPETELSAAWGSELRAALGAGRHVLVPINVKKREHVERIERHVVQALRDASAATRIAGLVMTGGATAADVCDALGGRALQLGGEVEQGVPWGTLCGGAADGLPMVLKSGAFGTSDTLIACLDFLVSRMNSV